MLAGVKIGGFSAVMGSILGYTGASVVKEHQDFRQYIDEHYEQEPQLYVQSPKDDSLNNKRRVSRSLPEIPGQRPLGSAKYMVSGCLVNSNKISNTKLLEKMGQEHGIVFGWKTWEV